MGKVKWNVLPRVAIRRDPQPAPVTLDDRLADGQPHSHPVGLGGEEPIEDAIDQAAGMPLPLSHRSTTTLHPVEGRANREPARPGRRIAHRLKALRIRLASTCSIWMRSPTTGAGLGQLETHLGLGHAGVDAYQLGYLAHQALMSTAVCTGLALVTNRRKRRIISAALSACSPT